MLNSESMAKIERNFRLEYKTIRLDSYTEYDKEFLDDHEDSYINKDRKYLSHLDTHSLNSFLQVY